MTGLANCKELLRHSGARATHEFSLPEDHHQAALARLAPPSGASTLPLRAVLREATAAEHGRLDAAMGTLDLSRPEDYARFLRVQLAGREPVEAWLAAVAGTDAPPPMSPLIRTDLEALGVDAPRQTGTPFDPGTAEGAIGTAWVLAGSHLGNRMMLRRLAERAPAGWPVAFLSDEQMAAHWRAILPALSTDRPDPAPAIASARATFAVILAAAAREGLVPARGEAA